MSYTDEPYAVDSSGALADAMQLYQDGKVPQAESAFHGIIAKDPSNGDAYYNLAVIAEGKNDLNGALSYYRSALNLNPQDTDLQSAVVSVQNKLAQTITVPLVMWPLAMPLVLISLPLVLSLRAPRAGSIQPKARLLMKLERANLKVQLLRLPMITKLATMIQQ
jgi:tetratricopeptide (TPR) repeat protein